MRRLVSTAAIAAIIGAGCVFAASADPTYQILKLKSSGVTGVYGKIRCSDGDSVTAFVNGGQQQHKTCYRTAWLGGKTYADSIPLEGTQRECFEKAQELWDQHFPPYHQAIQSVAESLCFNHIIPSFK